MTTHRPSPLVLIILDGFGHREERAANAVLLARTPSLDALNAVYPHTLIGTSGRDVGLPDGQMGNSEVGHLNFGAGRIAQMDIARIDVAVADGSLERNDAIASLLATARARGGRLHLYGLVSDGGVHSSIEHLDALIACAARASVPVVLHAQLDGRDTPPRSAEVYLTHVLQRLAGRGVIGTIGGRFYGMDRDKRWERVEKAYRAVVQGEGPRAPDALTALRTAYASGVSDEFVLPTVIGDYAGVESSSGAPRDVALCFNFRPDRVRQISLALTAPTFAPFARPTSKPFAQYTCMTQYDAALDLPVAFPKQRYDDIFPELIARAGLTQFRCAETEKYAHVTYFFNGGREAEFAGESRKLVPSPKSVDTYDRKPEMSAPEVRDAVLAEIARGEQDFILVNFANADMVGHTGVLHAAITAVEIVDQCVGAITRAAIAKGGAVIVTADHGNCETMCDRDTGLPFTAHTTNPVPLLLAAEPMRGVSLASGGRICDVAPTMLQLLGMEQPEAMTGHSLLPKSARWR